MARIEKRNGSYTTRVSLTDPVTGKRVQPRVTAHTKRELDAAVANLRAQWNAGGWVEPATITVGQLVTQWIRERPRRETSTLTYEHAARHVLGDSIARIPVGRLRRGDVTAFVERLETTKLSPAYIRTIMATVSGALAWAYGREIISTNPAARVRLPPIPARRPPALSVDQSRALIAGVRDDPLEAFWVLAVVLGIRRSELLALRWSDIDLQGGTVRVERTWTRVKRDGRHQWEIGATTKSESSQRTLRLPLICQAALARHRARGIADELVFPGIMPGTATHRWMRLRDHLGLPDHVPLHGLRHTAATVMIESGVPVTTVARILGHANATVTLRVYAAVFDDMERRASAVLDEVYEVNSARNVPKVADEAAEVASNGGN